MLDEIFTFCAKINPRFTDLEVSSILTLALNSGTAEQGGGGGGGGPGSPNNFSVID